MTIEKNQIRQVIEQNDLGTVTDVYAFMKESFKDPSGTNGGIDGCHAWIES